jgi:DNA ligase-1
VLKNFKPMLAGEAALETQRFPCLASTKIDALRLIVIKKVAMSRSLKPIPNRHVQARYGRAEYEGFDGELVVGKPNSPTCYRDSVSVIMSQEKPFDGMLYAFDHIGHANLPYAHRYMKLPSHMAGMLRVEQHLCNDLEALLAYESECLDLGFEGLCIRDPAGPYKCGRSSTREGWLLKLKRFVDFEATIVGFEERMHNGNEAKTNELGRTARSSHQENLVPMGTLGAFVMEKDGVQFNVGTGMDDDFRAWAWANRKTLKGQLGKCKSFPVGVKDKPRHPVWLGLRDRRDM